MRLVPSLISHCKSCFIVRFKSLFANVRLPLIFVHLSMDIKKLTAIYEAAHKLGVRELSIKVKSRRLQMVLKPGSGQAIIPTHANAAAAAAAVSAAPAPHNLEPQAGTKMSPSEQKVDILAPQIGFFSRYNVSTKKHYIKLRDQVKKGDVVACIKSMHLIYDVVAEHSGKIVEILVEEGQPVEYHQPLMRLLLP